MRDIKFRAWDIEYSKIIQDIQTCYDSSHGPAYGNCNFGDFLNDYRWIVEQYTGLKDKNGREVYEGDVIKIDESNYPVVFCDGCFMLDGYDNGDYYQGTDPLCTCWSESEIIGNIHENLDLLGRANE